MSYYEPRERKSTVLNPRREEFPSEDNTQSTTAIQDAYDAGRAALTSPIASDLDQQVRELVHKWEDEIDPVLLTLDSPERASLIARITAALQAEREAAKESERKRCAGIATAMAHGEDVSTGRLKAINIAAAITAED